MRRLTGAAVRQAERDLKRTDPVLGRLVDDHGPCTLHRGRAKPFNILGWSIVNQQLSSQAAQTIAGRVLALAGETDLTPDGILRVGPARLRGAGLSGAKVRYLTALARAVREGTLNFRALAQLDDEAAARRLTALPGIGAWTAQMYLMFALRRADVFSPADVVLQRAVHELYGLRGRPDPARLDSIAARWRPWRTVAAWYLWKHGD